MSDKITPEQIQELINAMQDRGARTRDESKYIERFAEGLKSADPLVRANAEKNKLLAMTQDNYKDALRSGKDALKGFHSALLDTSNGLTKYEHGVKNLGDATSSVLKNFGPLGNAAALAVQGLTALSGAILKQTQNMVGAYDEMAKVGGAMGLTADSIKEYGAQAQFTTHNLKVFAKAAAESSDSLVALGGSVSGGMKKFSEFTAVGDETLKQYRRMGMTQEDVLAAQQQYIKYQSAAGASLAKSPKELQRASLEYIDSLNKLADITGNSVKKQQEALDFAAQQENWNAYKFKREIERDEASKRGDTETAAKIDRELKAKEEFIAGTADLSQKDRGALLESIARSGAAVITENNAHLVNAGIQIDKITGNLAKGESQVIEYRSQNAEAQKNLSKQYGDGLTAYGSASRDLQKVVGADNEARRAAMKDQALLTKEGRAAAEKKLKDDIAAKKEGREGQGAVDTVATVESAERKYRSIEDAVIGALNPFTGSTGKSTLAVIALGVAAAGTAALMAKSVGALGSLGGGLLDKLKGLGGGAAKAGAPAAGSLAGWQAGPTAAGQGAAAAEGAAASSAKSLASSAAKGLSRLAGPLSGIIAVVGGLDTAATGIKEANKDLAEGKISQKEATVQKSGAVGKGVGQAGGGVAGAMAGAAIGTAIFPVVGTAIGAALGGWLGSKGGEKIGESVGEIVGDSISTDVKDIKKDLKNPDEIVKVSVVNPVNSPANVSIVKGLENLKLLSQTTSTLATKIEEIKSDEKIPAAPTATAPTATAPTATAPTAATSTAATAPAATAPVTPPSAAPVRRDGATQRQNLAASMPGEGSKGVIPTTAPTVAAKPATASAAAPAATPPTAAATAGTPPPPTAAPSSAGAGGGGQGGASAPPKMPSEATSVAEAKELGAATPQKAPPVPEFKAPPAAQAKKESPPTIPEAKGKVTGKKAPSAEEMGGKAKQFVEAAKSMGITNPYALRALAMTSAKESGLNTESKESGADPYLKTLAGKGLDYIYKVFPQLQGKTMTTGKDGKPKESWGRLAKKLGFENGVPAAYLEKEWAKGDEAFFSMMYDGLGTNKEQGDGYKYRGRGLIQLTGRENYAKVGKQIGIDLEKDPDLITKDFSTASKAAVAYMFNASGGKDKALQTMSGFTNNDDALKWTLQGVAGRGHKMEEFNDPKKHLGEQLKKAQGFSALGDTAISAKNGGITDGPMTGYPATLHGNEIITPLTPNSILEQLAKTVAEPSGAASAGTDDASAILKEMRDMQANFYAMMESKFTDMVDNLEESVDVQQNILQQSMT